MHTYTLAALLYGDHPKLAHRLLSTITDNLVTMRESTSHRAVVKDIRLGLNKISPTTFQVVGRFTEYLNKKLGHTVLWYVPQWRENEPAIKYPVMRRMIHGTIPLGSDYFMWFDDDSCMRERRDWLGEIDAEIDGAVACGIQYKRDHSVAQANWCRAQLWGFETNIKPGRITFPAGAWWAAKTSFLETWNYPFPEIRHCGGDSMLGQLLQGTGKMPEVRWLFAKNDFVFHNCDETLEPSSAGRRGHHEREFAEDFVGFPLETTHQNIPIHVTRFNSFGRVTHARDFGDGSTAERSTDSDDHAKRGTLSLADAEREFRLRELRGHLERVRVEPPVG